MIFHFISLLQDNNKVERTIGDAGPAFRFEWENAEA